MEARQGRDAAGGSMRYAHDSATGHVPWPGTPSFVRESSIVLSHQPCPEPGADLLQPSGRMYRNRHHFRNSTHPLRYASYRYH